MGRAFETGEYTDLFGGLGIPGEDVKERILGDFETVFFGAEDQRIYYEAPDGMGYIVDTGNNDVRTEGMSYGMMIAVQLDRQDLFDRLWKWAMAYMYQAEGENKGYFGWSASRDGVLNSTGPAPDGEEYFAMALFFAAGRWGSGEGIFNYIRQARALLRECVHKGEDGIGHPMFDPDNKLIKFVPDAPFTDPSYHLPHFYELFALWGNPDDADFFKSAAAESRKYLRKACHPVTGLSAEYADYDGAPRRVRNHYHFYSDSYRVAANIGLDWEWFGADEWQRGCADNIQRFFAETAKGKADIIYEIDGTPICQAALDWERDEELKTVLHPLALLVTTAQASLAARGAHKMEYVRRVWEASLREGGRRYYDNLLYLFALLALGGCYRIYPPSEAELGDPGNSL